jgi:hypothetical protein
MSTAILASVASGGNVISFDSSSLDLMDRMAAVCLSQSYGSLLTESAQAAPAASASLHQRNISHAISPSNLQQLLDLLDVASVVTTIAATDAVITASGNSSLAWDNQMALTGGAVSVVGTLSNNQALGALSALISTAPSWMHAWIDVYHFESGNPQAWSQAVNDVTAHQAQMGQDVVALALALAAISNPEVSVPLAIASGLSSVLNLDQIATNFSTANKTQIDAGNSIITSPQLTNGVITSDLLSDDGYVNLSGTSSVNQAGITLMLGGNTINALTDSNGNYRFLVPEGVSGVSYANGTATVVDPIGGQTLGSYTVNLSNATASTQLPQVTANYPPEPADWSISSCQSTQTEYDDDISFLEGSAVID